MQKELNWSTKTPGRPDEEFERYLGQGEMESDVVVAAGDHMAQRIGCGEEQRMGLRRVLQHDVLGVLVQHLPTAPLSFNFF